MVNYITKEAEQNLRDNLQSNPEGYESVRAPTHPPTLLEFVERYTPVLFSEAGKSFLPGIIDNSRNGNAILKMEWWTWTLDNKYSVPDLVTSDNPLFRSHGLGDERCIIALPISPRGAFFATRNSASLKAMIGHGPARVAKELNASMVNQPWNAASGPGVRDRGAARATVTLFRGPETL
jgi:hypothetical protein